MAFLRARSSGGQLVLRIEDLDPPRVVPGSAEAMCADLRWLGLDWDEGPDGGPHGPYSQSQRVDRYSAALAHLAHRGLVYPCTCTRREIATIASAPHGAADLGPRYPGTCRSSPAAPGRAATTRFRMPEPPPGFFDAIHGEVDPSEWGGDFVVQRADGLWSYQLAVVVDDADMGITEVVRGDDLLPSTPRQIALYRAFDLPVPCFMHVPLVLGADSQRLSKRHASVAISELRRGGMSPAELVGRIATSLGLAAEGERISAAELIGRFDPELIPREPFRWSAPSPETAPRS